MNLGDIAAWELQDRGLAITGHVGFDQHNGTCALGLADRRREIGDLVARHLPSIRIGKMAIGHQQSYPAEGGFNTDAPIGIGWSADLHTWRVAVVRNDPTMRESGEIADKGTG